jgi:hypothetical protein
MPYFAVSNANVTYLGEGYSGVFMEEIGRPNETASYPNVEEAIQVANLLKMKSGDQTDWNVINEFSERVVYSTIQPKTE